MCDDIDVLRVAAPGAANGKAQIQQHLNALEYVHLSIPIVCSLRSLWMHGDRRP